jgi:hypothetical protein
VCQLSGVSLGVCDRHALIGLVGVDVDVVVVVSRAVRRRTSYAAGQMRGQPILSGTEPGGPDSGARIWAGACARSARPGRSDEWRSARPAGAAPTVQSRSDARTRERLLAGELHDASKRSAARIDRPEPCREQSLVAQADSSAQLVEASAALARSETSEIVPLREPGPSRSRLPQSQAKEQRAERRRPESRLQ